MFLNYDREAAFWFMMISPLLFLLGILCCWIQAQQLVIPAFVGWILLALTIIGVLIMPVSGIWLLLIPSGIIIFVSFRNKDTNLYQPEK